MLTILSVTYTFFSLLVISRRKKDLKFCFSKVLKTVIVSIWVESSSVIASR